jgi:hypothetical protein
MANDIKINLGLEQPINIEFKETIEVIRERSFSYIHTQSIASDTWTINHPLQKFPSVTIVDTGDNVVFGDIEYINIGKIIITFSAAFSGKAYLN